MGHLYHGKLFLFAIRRSTEAVWWSIGSSSNPYRCAWGISRWRSLEKKTKMAALSKWAPSNYIWNITTFIWDDIVIFWFIIHLLVVTIGVHRSSRGVHLYFIFGGNLWNATALFEKIDQMLLRCPKFHWDSSRQTCQLMGFFFALPWLIILIPAMLHDHEDWYKDLCSSTFSVTVLNEILLLVEPNLSKSQPLSWIGTWLLRNGHSLGLWCCDVEVPSLLLLSCALELQWAAPRK